MTGSPYERFLRAARAEGGQPVSAGVLGKARSFLWTNKERIVTTVAAIRSWFRTGRGTTDSPGILVLGPGGGGKSTLAMLLSKDDYNPLYDLPEGYKESVEIERCRLPGQVPAEVIVPPGQPERRAATWGDLHADLAAGKYRGVILVFAFGHLSFSVSYKDHKLYHDDKERFLEEYWIAQRDEELKVFQELVPHMMASPGKLWVLTLVTKQDLWWPDTRQAWKHYTSGGFDAEIRKVYSRKEAHLFRHETVLSSLVISNFSSGAGEVLKPNAAGYDQHHQIQSLRKLFETLEALREWEAGNAGSA